MCHKTEPLSEKEKGKKKKEKKTLLVKQGKGCVLAEVNDTSIQGAIRSEG